MNGPTLTRRAFVKSGGALIVTLSLPAWAFGRGSAAAAAENSLDATALASWARGFARTAPSSSGPAAPRWASA